jgi:hypothetical protein
MLGSLMLIGISPWTIYEWDDIAFLVYSVNRFKESNTFVMCR